MRTSVGKLFDGKEQQVLTKLVSVLGEDRAEASRQATSGSCMTS